MFIQGWILIRFYAIENPASVHFQETGPLVIDLVTETADDIVFLSHRIRLKRIALQEIVQNLSSGTEEFHQSHGRFDSDRKSPFSRDSLHIWFPRLVPGNHLSFPPVHTRTDTIHESGLDGETTADHGTAIVPLETAELPLTSQQPHRVVCLEGECLSIILLARPAFITGDDPGIPVTAFADLRNIGGPIGNRAGNFT